MVRDMENNVKSEKRIIRRLRMKLDNIGIHGITIQLIDGIITLSGNTDSIDERVSAGYIGARIVRKSKIRGFVNDITVKGEGFFDMPSPLFEDDLLEGRVFDVVIIGGGVIGTSAARELSRYKLSIALLEKEEDLGLHASGRNDGMIHPGLASPPGSRKAYYNVRGNALYTKAAAELGFSLKRPGSLLLFHRFWMILLVPVLKIRCLQNRVPGTRYLSRKKIAALEPSLTGEQHGGFLMSTAGIVSPQKVVLAYGENAAQNGVKFFFNTSVTGITKEGNRISSITTNRGEIKAGVVINAAGIWADKIADFAGDRFFSLHPRKGVDAILDRKSGRFLNHIAGMPSLIGNSKSHSKGGGLVPCVEGNILLGPTASEIGMREDYSTHSGDIDELKTHLELNRDLSISDIITYYGGIRAASWSEDFIIQPSDRVENLVHAAGIQSPGLASAPALAEELASMVLCRLKISRPVEKSPDFNPVRIPPPVLAELSLEERLRWIEKDPAYGRIICRCEEISEGEVRDSLTGLLPARSVDGVKRRVRAGAGRCHGGFCLSRVVEIISGELKIPITGVTRNGAGSWLLMERKEGKYE